MPVTKTAKRALRGSLRKTSVNNIFRKNFDIALRIAKKDKSEKSVKKASSLADRAAKKGLIHKNKAARIKSMLSKIVKPTATPKTKKTKKN